MVPPAGIAECWVLDVGQGSSQIILLPNGGAIVIDCGPNHAEHVPLRLLKRYLRGPIEAFIITHNDTDHDGGAAKLFLEFAPQIRRAYFIHDRPHNDMLLWSVLEREKEKKRYTGQDAVRLEWSPDRQSIFADSTQQIYLDVIAPDFKTASAKIGKSNEMCGILILRCGARQIVFSGDSTESEWNVVRERLGQPLICDALIVPHHGAKLGNEASLYADCIKTEYAIISAGSRNSYNHPHKDTMTALVKSGCKILCTQITPNCCDDIEQLRPGMIQPTDPSRSTSKERINKNGRSKNVGCASSIVMTLSQQKALVQRYDTHQHAIDSKLGTAGFHPLCRK
jgi:competence protein ComEC